MLYLEPVGRYRISRSVSSEVLGVPYYGPFPCVSGEGKGVGDGKNPVL